MELNVSRIRARIMEIVWREGSSSPAIVTVIGEEKYATVRDITNIIHSNTDQILKNKSIFSDSD